MAIGRLRKSQEIRRAFREGRCLRNRLVRVHVLEAPGSGAAWRATVVAGAKVGGAVRRNRVKRRLREILRLTLAPDDRELDIVVMAEPGSAQATYWELQGAAVALFGRAGLLPRGGVRERDVRRPRTRDH